MSALPGALVGIITRFQTQYVGFVKIFFGHIGEIAPPSQDSNRNSKKMDGIDGYLSALPDGYAALYPSYR